jgi:hypothetical protein
MLQIGSEVSFGLTLHNERSRSDAANVAVLVNFVDSTNRVLGTAHLVVGRLPASSTFSTFSLGGQQLLSTKSVVSRLRSCWRRRPRSQTGQHAPAGQRPSDQPEHVRALT